MPAASEPLTPATTALKLSKVPNAFSRAVPPFGASALTYSKCLNPAEYFRSPNDDTPCRQFLSSANAAPMERDHVSGRGATASRIDPSSHLRFIRSSSFKPRAPRPLVIKVPRAQTDHATHRLRDTSMSGRQAIQN